MTKRFPIYLFLFALLAIASFELASFPTGSPSDGRTGSPGDGGKTCFTSGCHFGSPTVDNNIITSNIPPEGYTPGSTYTITVSVGGSSKKGFCVSPQKLDGTLVGTLTAGAGNQIVGSKYVTHSSGNTNSVAVWSFSWTAPAAGAGKVDFYGAFASSRATTRTAVYSVNEKTSTGINNVELISKLELHPNPIQNGEGFQLAFNAKQAGNFSLVLIDLTGKEVQTLDQGKLEMGAFNKSYNLDELQPGIYFIRLSSGDTQMSKRILVQ